MGTRHLKRITDECNITEKVVAAVTDNAANIAAAVRLNGWRHVDAKREFDSMLKNLSLISANRFCPREREPELDAVVS